MGTEILVRLVHPVAQTAVAELVEKITVATDQGGGGTRDRSQIAIGSARVTDIMQTVAQRQVGPHLPHISGVELDACIGIPAARVAERRLFAEESPPVRHRNAGNGIVQRISRSAYQSAKVAGVSRIGSDRGRIGAEERLSPPTLLTPATGVVLLPK